MNHIDPEAKAISDAWFAISGLSAAAQMRVIRYLATRTAVGAVDESFQGSHLEQQPDLPFDKGTMGAPELSDQLRATFADHQIESTANKILIAATMLQRQNQGRPLSAREIHELLKEAGVSVSNIAAHLNSIIQRRGRAQLTKITERNRQNRYLVTATGKRAVDYILDKSSDQFGKPESQRGPGVV